MPPVPASTRSILKSRFQSIDNAALPRVCGELPPPGNGRTAAAPPTRLKPASFAA